MKTKTFARVALSTIAASICFVLPVAKAQRFPTPRVEKVPSLPTSSLTGIPNPANPNDVAGIFQDMPCGVAISKNGKIAVSEYKWNGGEITRVRVWNSVAEFKNKATPQIINNIVSPEAIAFDNQERLYVVETEYNATQQRGTRLHRYALTNNKWVEQGGYQNGGWNPGDFVNPRGMFPTDNGKVYLANDGKGKIVVCDANSSTVTDFITGLKSPKAVAVVGNVLAVADYDDQAVKFYNINTKALIHTLAMQNPVDISVMGVAKLPIGLLNEPSGGYIAVSCVGKGVQVVQIAEKASLIKPVDKALFPIAGNVWGTAFYNGELFVSNPDHNKVTIFK